MPIIQRVIDYDKVLRQLRRSPIILNDLPDTTIADREAIQRLTQTHYTTDMLSALPQCDCGQTKGEHAVGVICSSCRTPVRNTIDEDIEPLVWFRKPEGVRALINPTVWTMLNNCFRKSNEFVLKWLIDTSYRFKKQPPEVIGLLDARFPRGYNNFVDNFDAIIEFLFSLSDFNPAKDRKRGDLKILLEEVRPYIFSDYLPIISRSLVIIEKGSFGIYMDPELKKAIDVVLTIAGVDNPTHNHSQKVKENMVFRVITKLANFYESFSRRVISDKSGILRKHLFAARTHFNFRAVITSLTAAHQYDEVHIPWSVGMVAFREHLLNKLFKKGFGLVDALMKLYQAVELYDPMLHEMFNEILAESPWGGLPIILQRNPSMLVGSAQCVRITHIKTDPDDKTIGMSILIVPAPNADFDGDEVNCAIAIDNEVAAKWMKIAPHINVFTLDDSPNQPSGNISIPKPVIATMNNWMSKPPGNPDPDKLKLMEQYFG